MENVKLFTENGTNLNHEEVILHNKIYGSDSPYIGQAFFQA